MQTKTLKTHGAASQQLVSTIFDGFGSRLNGFSALRRHTHSNFEFIFMVLHQTNPTMFSYVSLKCYSNLISESHTLGLLRTFPGQGWLAWSHYELTPQNRILEGSMYIPNFLTSSSKIMDLFISVFFFLVSYQFPIYISIF